MSLKQIITWVLTWKAILLVIALIAIRQVPFEPSFPYSEDLLSRYNSRLLVSHAHFDGVHYNTIITKGYHGTGLIQAFFPLYPMLVKVASLNSYINHIVIGTIISLSALVAALFFLYKLVSNKFSPKIANRTILLLLTFPTSFFFGMLYTESIFLLFIVLSFYFLDKDEWLYAGIFGALASATRLVGVCIVPAMVVKYLYEVKQTKDYSFTITDRRFLGSLLPITGIASFMAYLWQVFGDPLLFVNVQEEFGGGRETGSFVLLYQVFYRYFRMITTVEIQSWTYVVILQEFLAGLLGFILSIVSWFKTSPEWAVFTIASFIIPTLTGTFSSMPRYVLTIFPLFVIASILLKDWQYRLVLACSSILLVINIIGFVSGWWVA